MNPTMPKLAQLLRDNARRPRDYRVDAKGAADEAHLYVYDVIGLDFWTGEGVTAKQFARDLDGIKASTIHLHINSPGGDVFEARAMVAAMHRHSARFVVHIDGLAASAASFIAAHGDEVEIQQGGFVMVHNAWTIAIGDRNAMLETATLLEKVDGSIADDYVAKTKQPRDVVVGWMNDETWFTADEAKAAGLADRIAESQVKASAWNLAAYERAPKAAAAPEHDSAAHFAALERRLSLLERAPA